jgi:predicted extracellular nuclease
MKYKSIFIFVFLFSVLSSAQIKNDTLYVAHWNLENLFDTVDDPKTVDEEFLPTGEKEWTTERLDKKLYNLSRVIKSMNNGLGPDILGVCEVEHQAVLDTMIKKYLLDNTYSIAYLESPDGRGIDNGLIYDYLKLKLIDLKGLHVDLKSEGETRLILFATFLLDKKDTLYCFVNHWPSRRGGESKSEWRRVSAAQTLRKSVDELLGANKSSRIMIIGDFNDEPTNISIMENLRAAPFFCDSLNEEDLVEDTKTDLFNLSYHSWSKGEGSYFYHDDYNMIDQIIVSKNILLGKELSYICNSFEVYKPEMMVTRTGKYKGAPFPTYGGLRYLGGYSDHYPVIAKFKVNLK